MQKYDETDNSFMSDPALGGNPGTAAKSRRSAGTRPRPTPDSVGPTPQPHAKKKVRKKSSGNGLIAFFRDYRTHLAFGVILCTVALTMAIATISFIFNATYDQSVIHGRSIQEIVAAGDTVQTAGGILGAKVAELLLVNTFGVASFVMVIYIFLVGLACMRVRRTSFFTLTFRCVFATAALSIILGLATYNTPLLYNLGGDHGYYINSLVMTYADNLGAYGLSALLAGLLVAVFFYPIKSMFTAVGSMLARLRPAKPAEPAPQEAETPEEAGHISAFDGGEEGEEAVAAPVGEEASNDKEGESASEEIPEEHTRYLPPDLAVFDDGDTKDSEEADEEKENEPEDLEDEEETPGEKAEAADSEPELVIVNTGIDTEKAPDEPTGIRDGDHIGLDTPYDVNAEHSRYEFPPVDLLIERPKTFEVNEEEQAANKQLIVQALKSYNIDIVRIEATIGPTVTLYEIVPSQGTRIAKIKSLEDDIAMSLSALGIRIIAPIPGKGTIGIEVPNSKPQIVSMRTIIESRKFRETKMKLPMALGATISNEIYMADLTKMPHLLVAGATGQGKSVGLNCIITSLLYCKRPDELKFVLIDPKMVEFSLYRTIDRQYLAKIPDEDNAVITDPSKVIATLNSLCVEMDQRYELLQSARVRGIEDYNQRFVERRLNPEEGHRFLPYIVMVVDEYADLVMVAGKEIQQPICRIAQKARAVGMHMIIATQRPSTDVITGMIKANFPARIAFKVTQSIDSKTILDRTGAQRLIGRGDMLILINGIIERVQCALVDTPEVEAICQHIGSQPGFTGCYLLPEPPEEEGGEVSTADIKIDDEFRKCAMFIASQTSASITSMQRNFSLGFNKAGRYMDQMQRLGIVGPANGAKPRQVLMSPDQVERLLQ